VNGIRSRLSARSGLFKNEIALKLENKRMPNSQDTAQKWLNLLQDQALPHRSVFSDQVAAGTVASLCECGCNGFEFLVPGGAIVAPLKFGSGLFCELAFESNLSEEINILLFTDMHGNLCRVDVTYGAGNHDAMPDNITATRLIGIWPAQS